jgi:hypothetical protein
LLLVDMSGSVVNSGAVPEIEAAATNFATRVGKTQQVAVYAFDGSKDIYPISGFATGESSLKNGLAALRSFKPRDPSTNLNGAVIESLQVLDKQMAKATQPLRFATLVVFTDGSDRAHRVTHEALEKALDDSEGRRSVFVIGVGGELDQSELRSIGRTGVILAKDLAAVKDAFDRVAARVEGFTKSFYLFSYCSPARDGQHDVRIQANARHDGSGSISYHFNAHGFGPNCDPATPPAFDIAHPKSLRKVNQETQQ